MSVSVTSPLNAPVVALTDPTVISGVPDKPADVPVILLSVKATVPVESGNVIVLSAVASTEVMIVSKSLSVDPSIWN